MRIQTKQAPRVERDFQTVLQDDLRPAGNGKDCFYCGERLGSKHDTDCVIRRGAGWYYVAILNNETSEIRMYREDFEFDPSTDDFHWMEGNGSCDCNRHMYFARANSEEAEWNTPCGDTRYRVLFAVTRKGKVFQLQGADDADSVPRY